MDKGDFLIKTHKTKNSRHFQFSTLFNSFRQFNDSQNGKQKDPGNSPWNRCRSPSKLIILRVSHNKR